MILDDDDNGDGFARNGWKHKNFRTAYKRIRKDMHSSQQLAMRK
jgi:hypothetical protein